MSADQNYRVSWLMPVKNGMPYIAETLASLERQTYRDFEVIIWDNGSTDGTLEELARWIPSRLQGRVIADRPSSLAGSLAGLVASVDTELCARIDADDICSAERLGQQVKFLDDNPEIALVGSQLTVIDSNGVPTGAKLEYPLTHDEIIYRVLTGNPIGHPSVLFRREAVVAAGSYDPESVFEDFDLWLRLAERFRLENLPDFLVEYRWLESSYSRTIEKAQKTKTFHTKHLAVHAPGLLGISSSTATKLRERKKRLTIFTAIRIALYLNRTQAIGTWTTLRNPSFLDGIEGYTRQRDLFSRFVLSTLHPDDGTLAREIRTLVVGVRQALEARLASVFRHLGATRVRRATADFRWRRRTSAWRRSAALRNGLIDRTIAFTGRPDFQKFLRSGDRLQVEAQATFWFSTDEGADARLDLGHDVFIGRNAYLGAYQPIRIGNSVLVGAYSYIISGSHKYDDRTVPIREQGFRGAPITIEDDVWIGTHVTVLPGVTIGRGAVVAAGSVVNRDIPEFEVWGGVPAKFLKSRP